MRRNVLGVVVALLVVAGSLPAGQPKKGDKDSPPKDNLQGKWKLVKVERNGRGEAITNKSDEFFELTVSGDKMTLQLKDAKEEATYKADLTKKPKTIDITPTTGEDKGKAILGIYDLDGNKWKLCVAEADVKERPTEFRSRGDKVVVYEMERVK
jgi:uncharacterized protein (TIGR03067 family)